jgi:hypothetical protein
MLPVSLDCQFLIVLSVFSNVYLNTDGEQFYQYQQNDQPPLTIKHKKTTMVILQINHPYFLAWSAGMSMIATGLAFFHCYASFPI